MRVVMLQFVYAKKEDITYFLKWRGESSQLSKEVKKKTTYMLKSLRIEKEQIFYLKLWRKKRKCVLILLYTSNF